MTTEKARVTNVPIGNLEVEGLMFPDGSYGIALTQVSDLFELRKSDASRNVKALLGKGFELCKQSTEITNNKIQVLTLDEFVDVLKAGNQKGIKPATDLLNDLVGLSLHQLWSDAFGIKFDKEERQQWTKFRQVNRKQYHPLLTFWLKEDGTEGKEYGKRVNQFKIFASLPLKNVNEYSSDELELMNRKEVEYNLLRKLDYTHEEALRQL